VLDCASSARRLAANMSAARLSGGGGFFFFTPPGPPPLGVGGFDFFFFFFFQFSKKGGGLTPKKGGKRVVQVAGRALFAGYWNIRPSRWGACRVQLGDPSGSISRWNVPGRRAGWPWCMEVNGTSQRKARFVPSIMKGFSLPSVSFTARTTEGGLVMEWPIFGSAIGAADCEAIDGRDVVVGAELKSRLAGRKSGLISVASSSSRGCGSEVERYCQACLSAFLLPVSTARPATIADLSGYANPAKVQACMQ